MRETRLLMASPITVNIIEGNQKDLSRVFDYFKSIDEQFSLYSETSEISRLNRGGLQPEDYSEELKEILRLAEETKKETDGFFDINKVGKIDPSGIVKSWAIFNASQMIVMEGFRNFYINAGGDIQMLGKDESGVPWVAGIRNPFNLDEYIRIVQAENLGLATSGTALRGHHIYNPKKPDQEITDIVSLTVIGPNVFEADRYSTAAFAMGRAGIDFIESQEGLEGYMIDSKGQEITTTGFDEFVV